MIKSSRIKWAGT